MESSLWARFALFIKESIIQRTKQALSGVSMGCIASVNFLWAGPLAKILVGWMGWIVKGVGSVILAFSCGLATAYAGYLIERYKESKKKMPIKRRKRA